MTFVVYQITNTLNGKRYIGYTSKTLEQRFREHKSSARKGSNFYLHCAIRKYGESQFTSEVLCEEKELAGVKESEILYILDRNPEYNMTLGGDGVHGYVFTDEDREKIRKNTPVKRGPEHPMYGRKRPDIVDRNRSQKGKKNPNCARVGKDNPNYGKSRPHVIAAMLAALPRVVSEETRKKQSASAKKRALTEEGKRNLRLAGQKGAAVKHAIDRDKIASFTKGTESL
jgi:group I intron endonuclease